MYEGNSEVCDSVTLNRSVYMSGDIVQAIIYTNDDVESTALRCCLAASDFSENPNACDEDVTTFDEYEFFPGNPPG